MADKSVVKNSENDDNSICSDDDVLNNNAENSIQNILSNIQKIQKTSKIKKSKKKKDEEEEVVIEESDDDDDDDDEDIDVSGSSDNESSASDDDDEDDEDEDDEDGDEDDIFDSIGVTNEALGAMFQGVFIDNEGNTIADSLSKIAEELHKLNHNMKKSYSKTK